MHKIALTMVFALLAPALAANEAADACKACHVDALTLGTWEAGALGQRLKDMRDGKAGHVIPIPKLSDAEIEALAAALAGA